MNRTVWRVLFIVALLPAVSWPADPPWGDLRGRFLYDGDPPPVKVFQINKDRAEPGDAIEDESLLVNGTNRGIANMIVYLLPKDQVSLKVHPSYAESADATVELASKGGRIVPHVLLVRTSQTIFRRNRDKVGHSLSIVFLRNLVSGQLLSTGADQSRQYTKEEPLPVQVRCNIHPWMRGYVLLRSNPYMAKTDVDGRFQVKDLPEGEHEFRLWHERAGYLRNVRIGPHMTDATGRLQISIRPGENGLAETRLDPTMFEVGK